jgi:hypothetical protein
VLKDSATSRRKEDVGSMSDWLGLDFDHTNWTLRRLLTLFPSMACIAYSTTNSTATDRRWRVLTALSRACSVAEFAGVWRCFELLSGGQVDCSTKNCNRLHYLPAKWVGGNNEWWVQDGDRWDVDAMLEICPPEEPHYYEEVYELEGRKRPDGTEIITAAMIEHHMLGAKGGRFFKLLCAAATMHKAKGWVLSASELANAALDVSPVDSNGVRRAMSAYREAERAIGYIGGRVVTLSPQEQMVAAMKWKWEQQEVRLPR